MLDPIEYLLTQLMEECGEVVQRCSKIQRFGWGEKQPGQEKDNRQRLADEATDMIAVHGVLVEFGMLPTITTEAIYRKRERMVKYMQYSVEQGRLSELPMAFVHGRQASQSKQPAAAEAPPKPRIAWGAVKLDLDGMVYDWSNMSLAALKFAVNSWCSKAGKLTAVEEAALVGFWEMYAKLIPEYATSP